VVCLFVNVTAICWKSNCPPTRNLC